MTIANSWLAAKIGIWLAGLVILSVDAATSAAQVLVTVHAESPGAKIPADFLGLSYEKAMLGDDRKLRVVLINKDLSQSVVVSVSPDSPLWKGHVVRLIAPSEKSKDGISLAGSAVREDGTWRPQSAASVACVNGNFEVSLPPASAALLTLESAHVPGEKSGH